MAYIAKFINGANELDVSENGAISLGPDFIPPGINPEHNISVGTSANRYTGGSLAGTRYGDRDWTFSLKITATTETYARNLAKKVQRFLYASGPITFEWNGPGLVKPLWGQFGVLHYEIIYAVVSSDSLYAEDPRRCNYRLPITLRVKPLGTGQSQQLTTATGGVFEDNWGTVDGTSRGLVVGEATTNKMTNPGFTHATFGNGWTADTAITATQNTDPKYCLPGFASSAKITSSSAANNIYYQTIDPDSTAKHSISLYVKKRDGSAVTSSDCAVLYISSRTSTYTSIGNGWYRVCYENFTATDAANGVGIVVAAGRTVYLQFAQFEAKAYITPPCYGEMLGCAWTGTAHASTSTRTVGAVKLPISAGNFSVAEGAAVIYLKANQANTHTVNWGLWDTRDGGGHSTTLHLDYLVASDTFEFTDGTNTAASAAQTFSRGAYFAIYCYWGAGGIGVSVNGITPVTANFSYPSAGSNVFIGCAFTGGYETPAAIMGFTVFDRALTAAEIAAHYAAISPVLAADQRVDYIPWLWTKDGDNVVDNHNDSGHDNFCVMGGIPGDTPTEPTINGQLSTGFATVKEVMLSNLYSTGYWLTPEQLYVDYDGTGDANSSNAAYKTQSLTTSWVAFGAAKALTKQDWGQIAGRSGLVITRVNDQGSNLQMAGGYGYGSLAKSQATYNITIPSTFVLWRTEIVNLPSAESLYLDTLTMYATSGVTIAFKRTTGTTDMQIDWVQGMLKPVITLKTDQTIDGFILSGGHICQGYTVATSVPVVDIETIGDEFVLYPGKYNSVVSAIGSKAVNPVITYTLTYSRVDVTPRWSLL